MSRERTLLVKAQRSAVNTSDTAQQVTLTGVAGKTWIIKWINMSYNATPTGGAMTITTTGNTDTAMNGVVDGCFITAAGPAFHSWGDNWMYLGDGVTGTIDLTAGGASVKGQLAVMAKLVDAKLPTVG